MTALSHAVNVLTVNLTRAAVAATSLRVGGTLASGGLAAAASGAQALGAGLAAAHPAMLALTGAAAVGVTLWSQWAQKQADAERAVKSFTDAIVADTQALKENQHVGYQNLRALLTEKLGDKDALAGLETLGITLQEIQDMIVSSGSDPRPWREWLAGQVRLFNRYTGEFDAQATERWRKVFLEKGWSKAQGTLSQAGRPTFFIEQADALRALDKELTAATEGWDKAGQKMRFLGEDTKSTTQEIQDLTSGVQNLAAAIKGSANPELMAFRDIYKQIESVRSVEKGDIGALIDLYAGVAEKLSKVVETYDGMPDGVQRAAIATQLVVQEFMLAAEAAGFSRDQIMQLLDKLGALEAFKNVGIDINVNGVEEALARLAALNQALIALNARVLANPNDPGIPGAYQRLAEAREPQ